MKQKREVLICFIVLILINIAGCECEPPWFPWINISAGAVIAGIVYKIENGRK